MTEARNFWPTRPSQACKSTSWFLRMSEEWRGWFYTRVEDLEAAIQLKSIGVELKLQEIYLDT